ncbi:MAG: hypothetical protein JWM40_1069 [Frankiales bacterium]|nr:hypothetical protein [Frankiales bacterium]
MRARDALGRHVPADSIDAVEPVSEDALPPDQALDLAQRLLDQGRAFSAHEVLEAVWKAAPSEERDHWQGLAQLCVGVTHLQRGNREGAVTLLRRGAGRLSGRLVSWAEAEAERIEQADPAEEVEVPQLRLRDS